MIRVLKITIQVFWAMIGFFAGWLLIECFWRVTTGQAPNGAVEWIVAVPMLALFGALLFGAWRALFRFSPDAVQNTVFLISLFLFSLGERGVQRFGGPLVDPKHHSPGALLPLAILITLFVVVAGAIKYYRVTCSILTKALFPELDHSAARIF